MPKVPRDTIPVLTAWGPVRVRGSAFTPPPFWLLAELQEELQDAAVDLGRSMASGPDMNSWGPPEEAYHRASEALRTALALFSAPAPPKPSGTPTGPHRRSGVPRKRS